VESLKDKIGLVLYTNFQPDRGAKFLADKLGWKEKQLPTQVSTNAGMDEYFELIESWVEAFTNTDYKDY
jgi:hypothetical protein